MRVMRRLLAPLIAVLLLGCGSDDSAGKVTGSWGGPGREAGRFVKPRGVAVDPARGVVYVVDMSGRCQKFNMKGQFLSSWRLPDSRLGRRGLDADGTHQRIVKLIEGERSRTRLQGDTAKRQITLQIGEIARVAAVPSGRVAGGDFL